MSEKQSPDPMNRLVVSLQTARKLEEAGFLQENHYFYWNVGRENHPDDVIYLVAHYLVLNDSRHGYRFVAAPTAQEIADELPKGFNGGYLSAGWGGSQWDAWYELAEPATYTKSYDNMAEALAALWLKLHEAYP